MPSKTIDYIREKNRIQKDIDYYEGIIPIYSRMQKVRVQTLKNLKQELDNLEKDYYTNG